MTNYKNPVEWRIHFREALAEKLNSGLVRAGQKQRGTRESELADKFPFHVVCDRIGSTDSVGSKPYLQVTEDHFTKPLKHTAMLPRNGPQPKMLAHENSLCFRGVRPGGRWYTPAKWRIGDSYVGILSCRAVVSELFGVNW